MINFKKLLSDIKSKELDSLEVFAKGLEKADFEQKNPRDKNTILHLVFSSSDKDVVSVFTKRMKELSFSKEDTIKLLETQNKGGYNVIDKLLQFEDDASVVLDRINAFLEVIKKDTEMLDIFLSVKGEDGSIYDELMYDEDMPKIEKSELLEKIQDALVPSPRVFSEYFPLVVKNKDDAKREKIFSKNFAKNALVSELKVFVLEASLEQSENALSANRALDTSGFSYDSHAKAKGSSSEKVTQGVIASLPAYKGPVIEVSKAGLDSRMKEEVDKFNKFFKKELKDPENIVRKDIEKDYKGFCEGKITGAEFKAQHGTKLLKTGLDNYFENFAALQSAKKLIEGGAVDTENKLKAYVKYFSTKRITKTLTKNVDKLVVQVFDKGQEVDPKLFESLGLDSDVSDRITKYSEGYKKYEPTTYEQPTTYTDDEGEGAHHEHLGFGESYSAAETTNIVLQNKKHIEWVFGTTLEEALEDYISPAYVSGTVTTMHLGAAGAMSFFTASPLPLISTAMYSIGGVSGAMEHIMGEDHVDENAGAYIGLNMLSSSAVSGMAICSSFVGTSQIGCYSVVAGLDVASAMSPAIGHAYSLFSTGLMGVSSGMSPAGPASKVVKLASIGARAVHEMSDVSEYLFPAYNAQEEGGDLSGQCDVLEEILA